jgi:class 3 adenylate cyclase
VNVAARLEGTNKTFGTTICISDSVLNAVAPEVLSRPLRHVRVKGRKQDFMIYKLPHGRGTASQRGRVGASFVQRTGRDVG